MCITEMEVRAVVKCMAEIVSPIITANLGFLAANDKNEFCCTPNIGYQQLWAVYHGCGGWEMQVSKCIKMVSVKLSGS